MSPEIAHRSRQVRRLERLHAALGVVVCLVAWVGWGGDASADLAVGFALGAANLRVLHWLTGRMVLGDSGQRAGAAALLVLKLLALAGALAAALLWLRVDPMRLVAAMSLGPAVLLIGSALAAAPATAQEQAR